jgi:hypothetical protein
MVPEVYIWMMYGKVRFFLAAAAILSLALACTGCLSMNVGDASYHNRSVMVQVSDTGEPSGVTVQVTAYRIQDLHQQMYTIAEAPAVIQHGDTIVTVPVELEPGSYKLYIYILSGGDRKTAVIRDITV